LLETLDSLPAMRLAVAVGVAVLSLAAASCGDGGDAAVGDEAAIIETVDQANQTFAHGEYAKTCSYYSTKAQRELMRQTRAASCPKAWEAIASSLRQAFSAEELDALTSYGVESARVDGDSAVARFGKPPKALAGKVEVAAGATIRLRKIADRWVIDSLPQARGT
jgi:hypothetical protein